MKVRSNQWQRVRVGGAEQVFYKQTVKGCGWVAVSYTHLTLPTNREV